MPQGEKSVGPGQLHILVRAAGVNRADLLERLYAGSPAGRELSGEVLGVGAGVQGWSVGDRAMGLGPGFALEAVVPASHAVPVPDSWTWEEAGAVPLALMTMHDAMITNGALRWGGRVLMHAATSGVGALGVRLAALMGASVVFATSRSATKLVTLLDYLGDLAPCEVIGIDTSASPFESVAGEVDVIVDNIGASVLAGNIAAARVGARIVQVGRLGGSKTEIDLDELARKRIGLIGVTFRTRSEAEVAEVVRLAVRDVGDRMHLLRPRIDRVYRLSDLDSALTALGSNEHVGKLVVTP